MTFKLTTNNHSRDIAGLKYVYPVISRRSGGLSIGINFNPNNACNWRCIYCQVPDLKIGSAPDMDFELLETELRYFLTQVKTGAFYEAFNISKEQQQVKDIAISGNGEPTSLKEFPKAIQLIGRIATEFSVFPEANFVLITNGSLIHHTKVQQGLKILNQYQGEVWFKLDRASSNGLEHINHAALSPEKQLDNLLKAISLCPTKLQTCLVNYQNITFNETEKCAYLKVLEELKGLSNFKGVMLYSIARPSLQKEAEELEKPLKIVFDAIAKEIKSLGYPVAINV